MTQEEKTERVIQSLASLLRTTPFKVELVVKKKPAGITIIQEVTKEEMDEIMKNATRKESEQ